ncbi:hypothetical protein LINPERHAP2_LOCUS6564 [Linum perenne]
MLPTCNRAPPPVIS